MYVAGLVRGRLYDLSRNVTLSKRRYMKRRSRIAAFVEASAAEVEEIAMERAEGWTAALTLAREEASSPKATGRVTRSWKAAGQPRKDIPEPAVSRHHSSETEGRRSFKSASRSSNTALVGRQSQRVNVGSRREAAEDDVAPAPVICERK